MITIESLVDMGANVKLEVTPTDLKMFAESIIQRTIVAQQEEQKAAMQREAEETYLNTKQVRELLNVCEGTLNLWAKRGYLVPVKVGNKNMYAKSDFNWHNNTIERINAIRDEALVESRPMKSPVQVARLALVLQVLSYACGESHLQFVTTTAIEGAIRLNDYFEGSYRRIREYVANDACDEPSLELLALLKDTFTTAEALDAGRQLMVTERTVMNYLKGLAKNRLIHKIRQGVYDKVSYTPMKQTEDENCNV